MGSIFSQTWQNGLLGIRTNIFLLLNNSFLLTYRVVIKVDFSRILTFVTKALFIIVAIIIFIMNIWEPFFWITSRMTWIPLVLLLQLLWVIFALGVLPWCIDVDVALAAVSGGLAIFTVEGWATWVHLLYVEFVLLSVLFVEIFEIGMLKSLFCCYALVWGVG